MRTESEQQERQPHPTDSDNRIALNHALSRTALGTRQEYLLMLSDAMRPLRDSDVVKTVACRVLGEFLQTNRAFYAEVDGDDWVVAGGYAHSVEPLPPGRYAAETYGHNIMDTYRAGKNLVFHDCRTDPGFTPASRAAHAAISIIGAVGIPLVKEGKLVAILAVHTAEPRHWTTEEIAVVEETAERTWAAVERARSEASLRESETRFRVLTESLPQLVWTCLPDGSCDYLSRQWVAYTGVSVDEQLDFRWLDRVIHPNDRDRTREHWLGAVAGKHPYDIEYRIRGADGSYRWFQTRGVPMRDQHGAIVRWFGTCTDIDGRKAAEETLWRLNRELEEFAFVSSHDLQEPLRMVSLYTELLLTQCVPDNPDAHEYSAFIRKGVRRMEQLIHDLLSYSQVVHFDGASRQPADLNEALGQALATLGPRITETQAAIHAIPLPRVQGDVLQLSHVFQNLLSNSLKYCRTEVKPEIRISASHEGGSCIVCVEDNGIGFDQQYATKIFGLFKRLYKDEYSGTGLGLAICQRIVERYGGRIWAQGTPGQGARFYFSLPEFES